MHIAALLPAPALTAGKTPAFSGSRPGEPDGDHFVRRHPVRFGASSPTAYSFVSQPWKDVETELLVIPVFEQKGGIIQGTELRTLSDAMDGYPGLRINGRHDRFEGSEGSLLTLDGRPGDEAKAERIALVGLGDPAKLTPFKLEQILGDALESIGKQGKVRDIAVVLPPEHQKLWMGSLKIVPAIMGAVASTTYQAGDAKKPRKLDIRSVTLVNNPEGNETLKELKEQVYREKLNRSVQLGRAIVAARDVARDIGQVSYNRMTAKDFEEKARQLVASYPDLTWHKPKYERWIKTHMPAFYAVGQATQALGPEHRPRLLKITYSPPDGKVHKRVALIGKSILFDTGGVQSKGDHMTHMSRDKLGGAYVLGIMKALAELKPEGVEVNAYLPVTPNLPDALAMLPDDVIESASGKSVKIGHTDAEGRLTLIDAVTLAAREKADEIITFATLTGAAEAAVGENALLLGKEDGDFRFHGPHAALRHRLYNQARKQDEPVDMLPVKAEDFENIKSDADNADLDNDGKNAGKRGAQKAAAFVISGLPDGVDIPIAHFDIAGVMGDGGAGTNPPIPAVAIDTVIRDLLKTQKRYISQMRAEHGAYS